jgi:uncharacterized protein YjbI with pentapeptide repeats
MAEQIDDSWRECARKGCIGVRLAASRMCLAHASDAERGSALRAIEESGVADARGVPFTRALLEQVLAAAPRADDGTAEFKAALFDRATFTNARFAEVTFTGDARFEEARFTGDTRFERATFTGGAVFDHVLFSGDASFERAAFTGGNAWFRGAAFSGNAWFTAARFTDGWANFTGARFTGHAIFDEATFTDDAHFAGARFTRSASFRQATFTDATFFGATFTGGAGFPLATFTGFTRFAEATFRSPVTFYGARFEQAREFGPVLAYRGLDLDGTQFAQPVQIEISSTGVCCRGAQFPGGVKFRLRWARLVLDDTDFPAPSILTGIPRLSSERLVAEEERIAKAWQRLLAGEISERPQLLSLMRANVAGLSLSNITVADCRFAGAHSLDQLQLEADVSFALAPSPLGRLSWEGRQVIAEERDWRADRSRRWGWGASWWPGWLDSRPRVRDAGQIAGLYRALRKGREDIKDEPGAADFYYGEMEMRRHARPTQSGAAGALASSESRGQVERAILTAYWLVSGYGLRAWRALACLAVVTALLAIGFHLIGFTHPPRPVSYWTSLLYSFRATLSLTDSDVNLTAWGGLLQALLRITGPVLLGLALLALRGRVKR